ANSKDIKDYLAFMKKYYPDGDPKEYNNAYGYMQSNMLMRTLKQAGNDLTRENIMRQAANLKDVELPLLLPGIKVNTSPTDFYPLEQQMMAKFDGKEWKNFGDLLDK
ncbi:MAG: branched-chain amino acid ABC transporter substrate-binding protein, partial [Burkholderiales bacterium]